MALAAGPSATMSAMPDRPDRRRPPELPRSRRARCSRPRGSRSSARRRTARPRSRRPRELRPELVLLDVQLPDIDGFEVAARLTRGTGASPAVVLDLEPRRLRLRPARRAQRRARLRPEGRALGGGADRAARMRLGRGPGWLLAPSERGRRGLALAIVLTSDARAAHRSRRGAARCSSAARSSSAASSRWRAGPRTGSGRLLVRRRRRLVPRRALRRRQPLSYTLGTPFGALSLAIFIHLLFAFPNGHLESRARACSWARRTRVALLANLTGAAVRLDARRRLPEVPVERLPRRATAIDGERARAVLELRGRWRS